jgi:FkbM family methyltransferase
MVDSAAVHLPRQAYPETFLQTAGVMIPFDPEVITPPVLSAILEGRFEAREARRLAEIVEPGDRVLEIGAGIGFISTLLSRERRVASVLAVEANPALMDYMTRLHQRNRVRKVRRLNAVLAAAAAPRTATFYLRRDFWMGSLMPGPNPYLDTVEVPTRDLSALLREEAISLIVADVEGAETFLFDRIDLAPVDRIFIEVHDHLTGLAGVGALFATLAGHGFVYDPRHSEGSVILFRRLRLPEPPRHYLP